MVSWDEIIVHSFKFFCTQTQPKLERLLKSAGTSLSPLSSGRHSKYFYIMDRHYQFHQQCADVFFNFLVHVIPKRNPQVFSLVDLKTKTFRTYPKYLPCSIISTCIKSSSYQLEYFEVKSQFNEC